MEYPPLIGATVTLYASASSAEIELPEIVTDTPLDAFVIFVLPLLAAALGAVLGWQLAIGVGGEFAFWTKFGAGFFFVLSLVAIKLFDRQVAKKQGMKPVILEILED